MEIRLEECGCTVQQDHDARVHIEYCSLHKVAPDLYEALKEAEQHLIMLGTKSDSYARRSIKQALAKADGK